MARQSRAGLDARYGRQGGRIVPWHDDAEDVDDRPLHAWKPGDIVRLVDVPGSLHPTTGRADRLEVIAVIAAGARPVVRFPSGAELTVPSHLIERTT